MADARYTEQFAVVGTATQGGAIALLKEDHIDKSETVRLAVDMLFGFEDGELVEGDTLEAAVERVRAQLRPPRPPRDA
jgi:hypothetical protein